MLQKNKWLLIGAAAVIFLGFLAIRSCGTVDEISRLKGLLAESQRQANLDRAALEKSDIDRKADKKEHDKIVADLKADSAHQGTISADLKKEIVGNNAEIDALKKEREGLKDAPGIIANQEKQINTLEKNLSLERKDKAAIAKDRDNGWAAANLNAEDSAWYQNDAARWKDQDEADCRNLLIANGLIKKQDHRISWLQLKGTLETVAIVGAVGYIAYKLLVPAKTATGSKTLSLSFRF